MIAWIHDILYVTIIGVASDAIPVRLSWYINPSFNTSSLGTAAEIDCVAEETVARYPFPDDPRHDFTRMDAYGQLQQSTHIKPSYEW